MFSRKNNQPITLAQLLDGAEDLDHHQRWQYMIEQGRKSTENPALAQILTELALSDVHYQRMLAAMSLYGSHNQEMITRLLGDPSSVFASSVLKLAVKHLTSEQLITLIPQLAKRRRFRAFQLLLAARRTEVNDRLYSQTAGQERLDLLPFTSEAFVREHLDSTMAESLGATHWKLLANRFPAMVKTLLQAALNQPTEPSWQIQQSVRAVLHKLHQFAPDNGLALLQLASTRMHPQHLFLRLYARLFPEAVATLILDHPSHLAVCWPVAALKRLNELTLCALLEKRALQDFMAVFPKLLPAQRATLYQENAQAWRSAEGSLPLNYVKALPKSAREAEALHAFNAPLLQSKPMVRVPYLSVLPFPEAYGLAAPFINQPEGELRSIAVAALIQGGRYYPSELDAILDFCVKRENEQDPVRLSMINALASLPPTRWLPAHLPKIKLIVDAALRARDCSFQTMDAAARLLLNMIVPQTDFVVAELPALVERMGQLNTRSQESRMTDAEMVRLAPSLMPLLKTWIARDRAFIALGLIFGFGRRVKAVPEFARLMIDLTGDKRGHVARSGLEGLLRMEFTAEALALIPRLLEQDPSWIQVHAVAQYLHRHRQNLLTPFLKACIYRGRFDSGKTAILPGFERGFERWTQRQQTIYADSLQGIISSKKRSAWELYQVVHRLSVMPSVDLMPVIQLAQLDAKDAALRDKALEALGRADAGRGIPTLLEALDDARARIAIYALRRALLEMPAQGALPLLATVSSHKVTVVKEVIRLIGEFESDEAYFALQRFADDDSLHPDAQIALLRAFWRHLSHEGVWARFHAAARDERAALARATIRIPSEGLSSYERQQLSTQMTLLLQHTDALVRRETLERLVSMPLGQGTQALYEVLTQRLEDIEPDICQLAAEALLAAYTGQNDGELIHAFSKVVHAKSLVAIVDAYARRKHINIASLQASAQALADALLLRRWQAAQAARLVLLLLPATNSLIFIQRLQQAGLLHPGVVDLNLTTWNSVLAGRQQQEFEPIEAALRNAADPGLRRIGLGLLSALAGQYGWSDTLCAQLREYRSDKEAWVSDAAELIEPPPLLEA